MPKYPTATDDEWIAPSKKRYREMCCDCGLVHDVRFRVVDGAIGVRYIRNKRATSAARRGRIVLIAPEPYRTKIERYVKRLGGELVDGAE